MSVSVLIPFRSDDPDRLRALEWVMRKWNGVGEIIVASDVPRIYPLGHEDEGPWCKARAINEALSYGDGDVLVITDSDVWSDRALEAIECVVRGQASWAVPHRSVCRFNQEASRLIFEGERPEKLMALRARAALAEEQHGARFGGGMVVVKRKAYLECPMDPRFIGWGGEDEAWGYALETLYVGVRLHGPLWHLWHPHARRLSRNMGSKANEELRRRYQRACWKPDDMLAILGEAKVALLETAKETA